MFKQYKRRGGIMIQKKGQAAMEFLMTYGWALLVVLIAIGALAFFGVLNPSKFLPNSCSLAPGFACNDFKAAGSTDTITLIVQNGLGDNLNTVSMVLNNSNPSCDGTFLGASSINDGGSSTYTLACGTDLTAGTKLKGDLQINYIAGTNNLSHSKVGQL